MDWLYKYRPLYKLVDIFLISLKRTLWFYEYWLLLHLKRGVPNIVANASLFCFCRSAQPLFGLAIHVDHWIRIFIFSFRCKDVTHRCDIEMTISKTIGGSDVAPLRLEQFLKIKPRFTQKDLAVIHVNNSNLSLPEFFFFLRQFLIMRRLIHCSATGLRFTRSAYCLKYRS